MKHKHFVQLPLAVAVGALLSQHALAQAPVTELGVLEVQADRQGAKIKTNVVNTQEKDESTERDLRGLLQDEPAIEFGGGNGTSQFLTIRGMGQNSVDIKVDNAYSDSQILYHQGRFILDPSLIKIVAVQKGAGSASAGIGATNGAIVARTVDALDLLQNSERDYGLKVSSGFSSNLGASYGVTAFGRAGAFDALVSYNGNDERNYKPGKSYDNNQLNTDRVPFSGLDKTSTLAKIGATFGDHRLVLSHLKDEHKGVRLVREEFEITGGRLTLDRQSPSYRETTLTNTNLEYTGKNLGFISEVTANVYDMQNKRYSEDDSGCGYCGNVEGPNTTKINTRGANINFDSLIGENLLVKYGVNYRKQEIVPHAYFYEPFAGCHYYVDSNGSSTSAFAQSISSNCPNTYGVNPTKEDTGVYVEAIQDIGKFTLTGGIRYDRFEIKTHNDKKRSGSNVSPSVGVIYQATPNFSLSATHNRASRSPRLYDALMTHGKRGIFSIADDIEAETAKNSEVGFNYNYGGWRVDGSYFYQKIDDFVVNPQNRHSDSGMGTQPPLATINGVNSFYAEANNAGYAKNKGYELNVSYTRSGFTGRLGVSDSDPKFYIKNPRSSILNPEFATLTGRTWTGSLAYRFADPDIEVGVRHRKVESISGSTTYNIDTGAEVAPITRAGYNVSDVFVNWKPFANDNMNVNFAVNNVGNKLYYTHAQRNEALPAPGRDFRLALNYQF